LLCLAQISHASTIIGATGDVNTGRFDDNSFYQIDTDTGDATLLGSASVTPNQLAYDNTTSNLYYTDHNGSNFYRFDTDSQTEHLIADLTQVGLPAGLNSSGGGDFYNGRYFYAPESGTQGIYQVSFNPDGSSIQSHGQITPSNLGDFSDLSDGSTNAGLGDFGDIAIDNSTGKLYGSSTMHNDGESYVAFWSIDLTDENYTMEIINDNIDSPYQLAFDEDNNLWGNLTGANSGQSGRLVELNLETGAEESNVQVRLGNPPARGDFYDLASANLREGISLVPEPSSSLFLTLAAMIALSRRSRD